MRDRWHAGCYSRDVTATRDQVKFLSIKILPRQCRWAALERRHQNPHPRTGAPEVIILEPDHIYSFAIATRQREAVHAANRTAIDIDSSRGREQVHEVVRPGIRNLGRVTASTPERI